MKTTLGRHSAAHTTRASRSARASHERVVESIRSATRLIASVALLVLTSNGAVAETGAESEVQTSLLQVFGGGPIQFVANRGQADPSIKFYALDLGYAIDVTSDGPVLSFAAQLDRPLEVWRWEADPPADPPPAQEIAPPVMVTMRFPDANPDPEILGRDPLPGKVNYYQGDDASLWWEDIPTYAKVEYADLYPGIALVLHGTGQALKYDFIVAPGADPGMIVLDFDGVRSVAITEEGDLELDTDAGTLRRGSPVALQSHGDSERPVSVRYRQLGPRQIGFTVGAYDITKALVIDPPDPIVKFVNRRKPTGFQPLSIAVDDKGDFYLAGLMRYSAQTQKRWNHKGGKADVVVMKIVPSLSKLYIKPIWHTYLSSTGTDYAHAISGRFGSKAGQTALYIAGHAGWSDFPTTKGAHDRSFNGIAGIATLKACIDICASGDAFVASLDSAGKLRWSTYLGGKHIDDALDIAMNGSTTYVTGTTSRQEVTQVTGKKKAKHWVYDAFFAAFDDAGRRTDWDLRGYSGLTMTVGHGVAVGPKGEPLVAGWTKKKGGKADTFVWRPHGFNDLISLGAPALGSLAAYAIAIDDEGTIYLTGSTGSDDKESSIPMPPQYGKIFQKKVAGGKDAFFLKLTWDLEKEQYVTVDYFTYLGGAKDDVAWNIALSGEKAYIVGETWSPNFPVTKNTFGPIHGGGRDGFVTRFHEVDGLFSYSTYLNGSGDDWVQDVATRPEFAFDGDAFITGPMTSSIFPLGGMKPGSPPAKMKQPPGYFIARLHQKPPHFTLPEIPICGLFIAVTSPFVLLFRRRRSRGELEKLP